MTFSLFFLASNKDNNVIEHLYFKRAIIQRGNTSFTLAFFYIVVVSATIKSSFLFCNYLDFIFLSNSSIISSTVRRLLAISIKLA